MVGCSFGLVGEGGKGSSIFIVVGEVICPYCWDADKLTSCMEAMLLAVWGGVYFDGVKFSTSWSLLFIGILSSYEDSRCFSGKLFYWIRAALLV